MEGRTEQGPLARRDDLLLQRVGAELVLYDTREKEAHCLNPLATAVFERSDGRRSLDELASAATSELREPVDISQVEQAVAELGRRGLVNRGSDGNWISRRSLIRKTALAGAAAVAASPLITSLATPGSAYAAASCGGSCESTACPPGPICPGGKECKCTGNPKTCGC